MKQIKLLQASFLILVSILLFRGTTNGQNGLENLIVEKYYVSTAADSAGSSGLLPVGSVTYRLYADLLPGYKFQAVYGVPNHNMVLSTTTTFFNNEDYGATSPTYSSTNARKNTVMLDSWFSAGGAASNRLGVLKSEDTDGSVGNLNGLLANNIPSIGFPLTARDGFAVGTPVAVTFVGLNNTGNGDLGVFDGLSQIGGNFSSNNGSIAALGGSSGPTSTNRVLIGQFTTNGVFSFELNIQIGTPSGGVQNFVSSNPIGSEIQASFLIGTFGLPLNATSSVLQNCSCFGGSNGSASVAVSGGASPYIYSWSNGSTTSTVTGLSAGTYSVTVTDSFGETATSSVVITSPASLVVSASSNSPVCIGGNLNLNVSGTWVTTSWSGPQNFSSNLQNPSISPASSLNSGNYTVTVTDNNGCTASSTASVTVQPLSITVSANPSVVCSGAASALTATGGTTYSWSPSTFLNTTSGATVTARPTTT
ncbi:MAG: hypothetical protein ACKOA1_02970, partial [Bacteroidota bacterium]